MSPVQEHPAGPSAVEAVLAATRSLLRAEDPASIRTVAADLVRALGGGTVDDPDHPDALPIDLSFRESGPSWPAAPVGSLARQRLEHHLPAFVDDARRALEMLGRLDDLVVAGSIDPVTGLADRTMLDRALRRLHADDTVVKIDLERVEGSDGTSDDVLRVFGKVLRATSRGRDVVGRYEAEQFVAVLAGGGSATSFLRRLLDEWTANRPSSISFAAGIARSDGDPVATLAQVDHAVELAREAGPGRWVWVPGGPVPAELSARPDPR